MSDAYFYFYRLEEEIELLFIKDQVDTEQFGAFKLCTSAFEDTEKCMEHALLLEIGDQKLVLPLHKDNINHFLKSNRADFSYD